MSFRIGTIAFSTNTGLGYQTRDFCKHMLPTKILIDDLSAHNHMPVDHSWAPNARIVEHNDYVTDNGYSINEHLDWLCTDVDILIIHETPLNHGLYALARERGIKTVQVTNAEFVDGYRHSEWPRPDYMGMPTSWHNDEIRQLNMGEVISWPVPVDRTQIQYRHRDKCDTFVHIIGRPTYEDRNGTLIFVDAIRQLKDNFKYKIFFQEPTDPKAQHFFEPIREAINEVSQYVEVINDVADPNELYDGDVLVLPRRYGGLCLPMQEGLAAGLPVIMTDLTPNNDRLPSEWLIPAYYKNNFFFHAPVNVYDANGTDLVYKMAQFANPEWQSEQSLKANKIADGLSWSTLKHFYDIKIEEICQRSSS